MLWSEDLSVTGDGWNTYNVLILPDLTGDGVAEVILPNGGDPKFEPQVRVPFFPARHIRLILTNHHSGR